MLHIYNRHCNFSTISANKERPDWFDREKCFYSLLIDANTYPFQTKLTVMFDGVPNKEHFLKQDKFSNIHKINLSSGSGAKSFIDTVDYILTQPHHDEDVIYMVEDDYLHVLGWRSTLLSAFKLDIPNLHVTLYDHADKYDRRMYNGLASNIFITAHAHWRTTPSTTDTFAVKFSTLRYYRDLYAKFSEFTDYSQDHARSIEIWKQGGAFISPIPGWSTHVGEFNSPLINWRVVNNEV